MPIYEYRCPDCSREFEELVFGNEVPECPKCGGNKSERLLSCACLHMPAPSRAGQTVTFPKSSRSACGSCTSNNCSTCK